MLYAGTNAPNPRLAGLAGSPVGSRPNLGHPGAKHNRGMDAGSQLELLAQEAICRLFGCRYAELRVGSGSLANLYVYMATTRPGDRILAFADAAAGHPTHHTEGAAGLYGLEVHELPYDAAQMDVDLPRLAAVAARAAPEADHRRRLDVPAPVRRARRARGRRRGRRPRAVRRRAHGRADRRRTLPAAAAEGAHAITGSTYKSFGGPPSGMILTDDPALAERLDRSRSRA